MEPESGYLGGSSVTPLQLLLARNGCVILNREFHYEAPRSTLNRPNFKLRLLSVGYRALSSSSKAQMNEVLLIPVISKPSQAENPNLIRLAAPDDKSTNRPSSQSQWAYCPLMARQVGS